MDEVTMLGIERQEAWDRLRQKIPGTADYVYAYDNWSQINDRWREAMRPRDDEGVTLTFESGKILVSWRELRELRHWIDDHSFDPDE